MKNLSLLLIFLTCLTNSFSQVQPFNSLDPLQYGANKFEADDKEVESIVNAGSSPVTVSLPVLFGGQTEVDVLVSKQEIYANGFSVVTNLSNGNPVPVMLSKYYTGSISGQPKSVVVIGIDDNLKCFVFVDNGDSTCVLVQEGSLYGLYLQTDTTQLFTDNDLMNNVVSDATGFISGSNSGKSIGVYLETTYDYYLDFSSDTSLVCNYVSNVFAVAAAVFAAEGIPVKLTDLYIWVTPDPYVDSTIFLILDRFALLRNSFNGNIAQLMKKTIVSDSIAGIAPCSCASTCSTKTHSVHNFFRFVNPYPQLNPAAATMAHELGHNMGSPHTHSCSWPTGPLDACYPPEPQTCPLPPGNYPPTIMSYCNGNTVANGFGLLPGNKIRDSYLQMDTTCLFDPVSSQITHRCTYIPDGLSVNSISYNTATASWNSTPAGNYMLEYREIGNGNTHVLFTTDTVVQLNNLEYCKQYSARVQSVCDLTGSYFSQSVQFGTYLSEACKSQGGTTAFGYINSVKINASTRITGDNGGYYLVPCPYIEVTPGNLCYLELEPGVPPFQPEPVVYWKAWIDINQDNIFDEPAELFFESGPTTGKIYANALLPVVPLVLGEHIPKIRIAMKEGSAPMPCEIYSFGETEDFAVRYVSPDICFSRSTDDSEHWIERVKIDTVFDNVTGQSGGYYFSDSTFTLEPGSTYTLQITSGHNDINRRMYYRAWIDYDDNKVFDNSEMILDRYISQFLSTATQQFTVPTGQQNTVRMRTALKQYSAPNPCEIYNNGEVEDYTVKISYGGLRNTSIKTAGNIELYPNPANDQVSVRITDDWAKIEILNNLGQALYRANYFNYNGLQSIDLSGFESGIYFVKVYTENNTGSFKLIISH